MTENIKAIWTNEDFENMGWHDNRLYGIIFDTQNFRLLLDIDYIFEWSDSWDSFLVAPCSIDFENVSNTNIKIEFGNTQNIIVSRVIRMNERKTPNGNLQWFFVIETDVGDISFWATGFTQKLRDRPIWSVSQDLNRSPSF